MQERLVLFLDKYRGTDIAEKEIYHFIDANPDQLEPIHWLTDLYLSHDKSDQALIFLNTLTARKKHDPVSLRAMILVARIDYGKGDKEASSKLVSQVLAENPDDVEAELLKIRLSADQGSDEQAVLDLRSLLQSKPHTEEAYRLLNDILLRQGHQDLAAEVMGQLALLQPRMPLISVLVGQTKKIAHNNDKIIEDPTISRPPH
jgi:lipopolysaccharide biosynthesis regulator YciM